MISKLNQMNISNFMIRRVPEGSAICFYLSKSGKPNLWRSSQLLEKVIKTEESTLYKFLFGKKLKHTFFQWISTKNRYRDFFNVVVL